MAIDVDPRCGGEDGFAQLAGKLGNPGRTVRVLTPSGGYHLWYRAPDAAVACSAGKLAAGVDVRADGGYVVAPPTTRPDRTGWRWTGRAPLAELQPEWLEALTAQNATAPSRTRARPAAGEGSRVAMLAAGIASGQRNQALTSLIGHLLAHDIDVHLAAHLLHLVNKSACRPPLDAIEVEKIVASIAGRELRKRKGTR